MVLFVYGSFDDFALFLTLSPPADPGGQSGLGPGFKYESCQDCIFRFIFQNRTSSCVRFVRANARSMYANLPFHWFFLPSGRWPTLVIHSSQMEGAFFPPSGRV